MKEATTAQPGRSAKDLLRVAHTDASLSLAVLPSFHDRQNGLADIEPRHLWMEMN
jgi:hypothetical protein